MHLCDTPSPEVDTPRSLDVQIAAVARGQHGLITSAQLARLGLATTSISHRARTGRLHRVHRGVYAVGHADLSEHARWHAAVLAVGDDAALSHKAAASLWNIWRRSVPSIDVVASRRHKPIEGITVHACRRLDRRQVQRRERIPVTSVARTILDLGDLLTPYQLANVMHEADFRRYRWEREIHRLLARARGRRAVTIVRDALALRATGSIGTLSRLEDEFLRLAHARGLDPFVNVQVDVGDGMLRPDFHWPGANVLVEVDGGGHDRVRSTRDDLGRDSRFRAAGWTVLRTTRTEFQATLDQVELLLRGGV